MIEFLAAIFVILGVAFLILATIGVFLLVSLGVAAIIYEIFNWITTRGVNHESNS